LNYSNKQYVEYRALLEDLFPAPKLVSGNAIKVEPLTNSYTLIATAFDYLLRFTLEKNFRGFVFGDKWIAESALKYFQSIQIIGDLKRMNFDSIVKLQEKKEENHKLINEKFNHCKKLYSEYINSSTADISDKLLEAVLFLSRLDILYRTRPFNVKGLKLVPENPDHIKELRLLLKNCKLDLFKPQKKIILNPFLGKGSIVPGGADADLIVDNTLLGIKVTKEQKVTRHIYNQLITYYLIYLIGGVDKHKGTKVENLGIYFARHNFLWTIPVSEVGSKDDFKKAIVKLKRKK